LVRTAGRGVGEKKRIPQNAGETQPGRKKSLQGLREGSKETEGAGGGKRASTARKVESGGKAIYGWGGSTREVFQEGVGGAS